jgi:hypothetical protein
MLIEFYYIRTHFVGTCSAFIIFNVNILLNYYSFTSTFDVSDVSVHQDLNLCGFWKTFSSDITGTYFNILLYCI